jgi:hypothetical protein
MTVYAQVPETSAVYTLTGPDGSRAVLNDTTDTDYVGTFNADGITGLDDAEIRENAWDLVEADGGVHGPFWLGRRPFTLTIDVTGATAQQRNARMEKVKRATNALRADGIMSWTTPNGGGPNQQISFRRQQPRRWSNVGFLKTCFLGLVAADPRIYSTTLNTNTQLQADGFQTWTNQGDYLSPPSLKINGPGTNPSVFNGTLGIIFNGLVLTAGQYVVVDLVQRTVVDQSGANRFGTVDFLNTAWWQLGPNNNSVKITWASGNTAASTLVGTWRDAWV